MESKTWGPQQDTESHASFNNSMVETPQYWSVCFLPSKFLQAWGLSIFVVPVEIGFTPNFSGEFRNFIGIGWRVASLYFHHDGTKVSTENEVGQGGDNNLPFTSWVVCYEKFHGKFWGLNSELPDFDLATRDDRIQAPFGKEWPPPKSLRCLQCIATDRQA